MVLRYFQYLYLIIVIMLNGFKSAALILLRKIEIHLKRKNPLNNNHFKTYNLITILKLRTKKQKNNFSIFRFFRKILILHFFV